MMPAHFKNQHIGENVLENAVLNTNRVHFLEFARVTGYYVGIPTTVASSYVVVVLASGSQGKRARALSPPGHVSLLQYFKHV